MRILKTILLALLAMLFSLSTKAQAETFPPNSFIINMGVESQTMQNAARPYGMIYDLIQIYKVPIKWVINPDKIKDGVDFTFEGNQFKGSAFIISAEYRTPVINARIAYWQSVGVIGHTTTSPLTINVYETLASVPRWTLDLKNGAIARAYLDNALIPATAYNFKEPQLLNCCDDIFAMPHADPTWASHSNLFFWNDNCKGGIWAACHAVSALENAINPSNSAQQMNFLSQRNPAKITPLPWPSNSLILWGSHSNGTPPYINRLPADPVAQYLGSIDLATQNGSEQIYIPIQPDVNTKWNPGANIVVYDPTQVNVPNPQPDLSKAAAVMVYGRGFDNPDRGYVMYEGGHSHAKATGPANVAAQRAFHNFCLLNQIERVPIINTVTNPPEVVSNALGPYLFEITASPRFGGVLTYQWSSSCGGTFSSSSSPSTQFTPPVVTEDQT